MKMEVTKMEHGKHKAGMNPKMPMKGMPMMSQSQMQKMMGSGMPKNMPREGMLGKKKRY